MDKITVLVASFNPSKVNATKEVFGSIFDCPIEVVSHNVSSHVSSKPISKEVFQGAYNRAYNLTLLNQEYDYAVGIEGGFTNLGKDYYVFTAACIFDKNGKTATGISSYCPISSLVYDFIKKGHSINSLIGSEQGDINYKQNKGLVGYLSEGIINREDTNKEAIRMALLPFKSISSYNELETLIKNYKPR